MRMKEKLGPIGKMFSIRFAGCKFTWQRSLVLVYLSDVIIFLTFECDIIQPRATTDMECNMLQAFRSDKMVYLSFKKTTPRFPLMISLLHV